MTTSLIVSALIIWSGDFSARLQFNGPLKTEIKGEFLSDSTTSTSAQSEKDCEVFAQFDETKMKQKNGIEKWIKINFKFICTQDGQKKTYRISPEFIRSSDLKTHSSRVYISKQFKKNSFKIEDFSLQSGK